ncbi:MAG: phosphoribosylformylglycinamidine synthase subunit PurL [Endomicrobia bacterium]|nr:phosphoribosylformylglycinamidine synthase subunit PurL [Endomicrobiia bacterium]
MNRNNMEILKLSDKELVNFSKKNSLSLNLQEMKAVQNYFKKLKREPAKAELETIAQTWSEHCKHKTLTGVIKYKGADSKGKKVNVTYNNMLKETIFKATMELNKPWCLSVFRDNAGVIEFDRLSGIAFKDETHNHPSALDPYAGAATGVGGCVRDIMGVGTGAKPLAVTGVLCVGNPETPANKVPKGSHHPKFVLKNAVAGVRDYSRDHGIPVINGGVRFDDGYMSNPLVYAGVMGIMPKSAINKDVKTGDLAVAVGRKTWLDGIHGATMSSRDLDENAGASGVPQGNPKFQKKILDAQLKARDLKLYRAVTDCGAGGYSSAFGELGEKTGVNIELEKIPVLKKGLEPWQIWVSETQERMAFVVPAKNIKKFLEIFKKAGVEAVVIGKFTSDKKLTLTYNNAFVAQMDMEFLHKGVPKSIKNAVYTPKKETLQKPVKFNDAKIKESLKKVLADLAVCSQEPIIKKYNSEVQGQTVVKPLAGGVPSDASVICPDKVIKGTKKGIVLSHGLNPEYGKVNTYKMAASAVEESLRNAVAVGANPDRIAVLDNFCWGNPNKPEVLGSLVAAARACYDMSKKFGVPFISGKDSLYNEYTVGGKAYAIPSALLISAMGVADNVKNTMTMDFKRAGNIIMLLGITRNELGQSVFNRVNKISGGVVPEVYPEESLKIMRGIYKAANKGLIKACHDISAGGLATAVSEMAFAGQKCVKINIDAVKCKEKMTFAEILFSESNGRFIVEVSPDNAAKVKEIFKGSVCSEIGHVCNCSEIIFESDKNKINAAEKSAILLSSWKNTINL